MLNGTEILDKCSGLPAPSPAQASLMARQWARDMASDLPGLDMTATSVEVIEKTLLQAREENQCDTIEEFDTAAGFLFFLGLVYGETLRLAINAKWVAADRALGMPLALEVRDGERKMIWNPFGKVFKMLDDPEADSVLGFFHYVVKNPMGP